MQDSDFKNNYDRCHQHLRKYYGPANHCENKYCPGTSDIFHWANINGHVYDTDVNNYRQLCILCHRRYDKGTGSYRIRFPKNIKRDQIFTKKGRQKYIYKTEEEKFINRSKSQKGKPKSLETRTKMSISAKKRWAIQNNHLYTSI